MRLSEARRTAIALLIIQEFAQEYTKAGLALWPPRRIGADVVAGPFLSCCVVVPPLPVPALAPASIFGQACQAVSED